MRNGIFKGNGNYVKNSTIGILIFPLAVFNQAVVDIRVEIRQESGRNGGGRREERFEFNLDLICQRWGPE